MREIGSEFWEVQTSSKANTLFPESTQWFLSGRSALKAILRELGEMKSVSLPSWCCDSMIQPFAEAGLRLRFYPVYWQDGLIGEPNLDNDVLFLMDYFGFTAPAPLLSGYKGIVIRDVTHSIFSTSYSDADYCFGSLRKWCGVWTGGYAWTRDGHPLENEHTDDFGYTALRKRAMQLKSGYIHGQGVADKGYLKVFENAEETLERAGIAPAADRDILLAKRLDADSMRKQRRANAAVLRSAFRDWLVFRDMKDTDCPMFVPVIVPDSRRNALRGFLTRNEIYCPIHWPVSEYHRLTERERFLYDNELSLVCDQRYTEEDMDRIVETITMFMEE